VTIVTTLPPLPSDRAGFLVERFAIASVVAMLAAGMFEYNFGDSEFLMLFLVLITLPFAATRPEAAIPRTS
jgi:hypothetical protein